MSKAFCSGSIGCLFYNNAAIDCITLHYLERAASHDGDGFLKSEEIVDLSADLDKIEL